MTNIAKRAPKNNSTVKPTALSQARPPAAKKAVQQSSTAWGTFQDGELTNIFMTRTAARDSQSGTAKKVTIQLAS